MAILPKSTSVGVTLASATERLQPLITKTQDIAFTTFATSKAILDRYPPLKAFAISLALFSLIPVVFFSGFAISSGAVILGVAGTGAAVVQGTFLAFGSFFLFWFLVGALVFAGIATFWFSAVYFGLQTAKKVAKKA